MDDDSCLLQTIFSRRTRSRTRSGSGVGGVSVGFSSHSHAKFVNQLMRESRFRVSRGERGHTHVGPRSPYWTCVDMSRMSSPQLSHVSGQVSSLYNGRHFLMCNRPPEKMGILPQYVHTTLAGIMSVWPEDSYSNEIALGSQMDPPQYPLPCEGVHVHVWQCN